MFPAKTHRILSILEDHSWSVWNGDRQEGVTCGAVYDDVQNKKDECQPLTHDTLQAIYVYITWAAASIQNHDLPVSGELHRLTQGSYGNFSEPSTVAGVKLIRSYKGPHQTDNRPTRDQSEAARSMEEGTKRIPWTLRDL